MTVTTMNHPERLSRLGLAAGMIGNVLEWYDFGLYGYLAPLFATLFFPATDRVASLIAAYGGFAIGFAMRPFGALVLGHYGDRFGRQTILIASVTMMGLATTAIGLLPTYDEIGIAAPLSLLFIRLFQGFSVGGEFTGSVSYLVETAPAGRRGFAGSFANIGSTLGFLLAAGVAAITVGAAVSHPTLHWLWRVPFIVGGMIAVLAFWLRTRLPESAYQPEPHQPGDDLPLIKAFKRSPRVLIVMMVFTLGYGIVNYLSMVFFSTFASQFGKIAQADALSINTAAQGVALVTVPIAGYLNDHWVRRRTLIIVAFGLFFASGLLFFWLAQTPSLLAFALAQCAFALFLGLIMGTEPAMLSESFHSEHRLSGYSLAFNFGLGFGGGTAPLIATALIHWTGNVLAPGFYLMLGAAMAMGAAYLMTDRSREPLR